MDEQSFFESIVDSLISAGLSESQVREAVCHQVPNAEMKTAICSTVQKRFAQFFTSNQTPIPVNDVCQQQDSNIVDKALFQDSAYAERLKKQTAEEEVVTEPEVEVHLAREAKKDEMLKILGEVASEADKRGLTKQAQILDKALVDLATIIAASE